MTGVNVKAQRRPIFDKAEDLDKHARQTRYAPEGRGEMQLIMQEAEHNLGSCKESCNEAHVQQF